jgi:DNA-binding Xre family transcriptional regulator
MHIVLKQYLERIDKEEREKPPSQRRRVPSIRELAKAVDMHEVNLSRLANDRVSDLRLSTAAKIIGTMRQYGFSMDVSDFLVYTPDTPDTTD